MVKSVVATRLSAVAGDFPVLAIEGLVAMPDNPDDGGHSEDCGYPVEGDGVAPGVIT